MRIMNTVRTIDLSELEQQQVAALFLYTVSSLVAVIIVATTSKQL